MSTPADLSAADLTGLPATMRRAVDFDTGPDEGPVRVVYDESHLAAAEQRGYRRAIQALKDLPHSQAEHAALWRFVHALQAAAEPVDTEGAPT